MHSTRAIHQHSTGRVPWPGALVIPMERLQGAAGVACVCQEFDGDVLSSKFHKAARSIKIEQPHTELLRPLGPKILLVDVHGVMDRKVQADNADLHRHLSTEMLSPVMKVQATSMTTEHVQYYAHFNVWWSDSRRAPGRSKGCEGFLPLMETSIPIGRSMRTVSSRRLCKYRWIRGSMVHRKPVSKLLFNTTNRLLELEKSKSI